MNLTDLTPTQLAELARDVASKQHEEQDSTDKAHVEARAARKDKAHEGGEDYFEVIKIGDPFTYYVAKDNPKKNTTKGYVTKFYDKDMVLIHLQGAWRNTLTPLTNARRVAAIVNSIKD